MSAFEWGRMVGLPDLSYCDIVAHTGHAATAVMSVWNQWRDEGCMQRRAGTVRIAVMDHTASSTVLSRCWSTATGLDLSASTVRRHLLRAGLVARMPLHRLPLSRDHQCLRLQWTEWRAEWQNVIFSDESRFNISYNDGHICV